MPNVIKAIRSEVSKTFPIPGFQIRTDVSPVWGEIAVATSPDLLFDPASRSRRTPANFYSSRAAGLFPIERGESIYLLPPRVMARFVGQPALFYALATYPQPEFRNATVTRLPSQAVPCIVISRSYQGESPGILGGAGPHGAGGGNGYGTGTPVLEWGGDGAPAGEVVPVAAPTPKEGSADQPAPQAQPAQSAAQEYDDGFAPSLWAQPLAYAPPAGAVAKPTAPKYRAGKAHTFGEQQFMVNWDDVQLVPQATGMSCWAAAAAMVVGWRDRVSIGPESIGEQSGYTWEYFVGLDPDNIDELAQALRLMAEPPQCYTVEGWRRLLESNGPLWVGVRSQKKGSGRHAVVVTGLYGDGNLDSTHVRIKDPWPPGVGSEYSKGLREFAQEYENFISVDPVEGSVNVQVLHAGGRNPASATQGYAGALALMPLDAGAVDQMRQVFVANAASSSRQNCITIANAGLRQLYGAALRNPDGTNKRLGSTIQDTMAALQGYGLADPPQVFEFNDAGGRLTRGIARPVALRDEVDGWLLAQAEAGQMSAWYCFGLSLMDGYHSVILALQFSGRDDPQTHLYWADQIYGGWDDVTGGLDARITRLTQQWWDPLPLDRKARTRVTVWPLLSPATAGGLALGEEEEAEVEVGEMDEGEGNEDDVELEMEMSMAQALTCTDDFCPVNPAPSASSANFTLDEFRSKGKDGTITPVPERFRGNVQEVMDNLEVLRAELGGPRIFITSGYRTCAHNAEVEGASRSRHLCGQAADIKVEGVSAEVVFDTVERLLAAGRMRQGGHHLYRKQPESRSFVHYDVRGKHQHW